MRRFSAITHEGLVFHENGTVIDVNEALVKMFGYSNRRDFIGTSLLDHITPESRTTMMHHVRSGSTDPYELIVVRNDGSRFTVDVWPQTYAYQGRTVRVVSVHDITERKKSEEELKKYRDHLENW